MRGDPKPPPDPYRSLKVVAPAAFTVFRLDESTLAAFAHQTLHRPRRPSIFKGPLLLCAKVPNTSGAERGRYGAAVHEEDILYTENFYGVSFYDSDSAYAYALCGILNSSMTAFQLALGGPTWGLERPTVAPHDLLSLRVPRLAPPDSSAIQAALSAERAAAAAPDDRRKLAALDDSVLDLYGLEAKERVLVAESVDRARALILENRRERRRLTIPPNQDVLHEYAARVAMTINAYLRAQNTRHIEAAIYRRRFTTSNFASRIPGVTAVRFRMAPGAPGLEPIVREDDPSYLDALVTKLSGYFGADSPPYLNERRVLRIYGDDELFILSLVSG